MPEYISHTEKETLEFAKEFSKTLIGGEIIALQGDLGAGKTVFTKGLAKGLNVEQNVNSPTFVLMKVYPASYGNIKQLVHIDAYRLRSARELDNIGAIEYFGKKDTVTVIEWPENIKKALPKKVARFILSAKNEKRQIFFSGK